MFLSLCQDKSAKETGKQHCHCRLERDRESVCASPGRVAPPSFLFRLPLPLQIGTSNHELPVDFLSPGKKSKLELNCIETSPRSRGENGMVAAAPGSA
ncbi:Hypothetical predicted protein, partial [Lynx pardinus]